MGKKLIRDNMSYFDQIDNIENLNWQQCAVQLNDKLGVSLVWTPKDFQEFEKQKKKRVENVRKTKRDILQSK
tara:strand:+ start:41 stop:256 length:216 start_codon:yes stop_codon:yes gene_type:complete